MQHCHNQAYTELSSLGRDKNAPKMPQKWDPFSGISLDNQHEIAQQDSGAPSELYQQGLPQREFAGDPSDGCYSAVLQMCAQTPLRGECGIGRDYLASDVAHLL